MRIVKRLACSLIVLTATLTTASMSQPGVQESAEEEETEITVIIENYEFIPKEVTVKPGTTVTWLNQDGSEHTATADDDSFDTDLLEFGESQSVTFSESGSHPYYCAPHPFMRGTVVVQ